MLPSAQIDSRLLEPRRMIVGPRRWRTDLLRNDEFMARCPPSAPASGSRNP